jgi:hypothetical protein
MGLFGGLSNASLFIVSVDILILYENTDSQECGRC